MRKKKTKSGDGFSGWPLTLVYDLLPRVSKRLPRQVGKRATVRAAAAQTLFLRHSSSPGQCWVETAIDTF